MPKKTFYPYSEENQEILKKTKIAYSFKHLSCSNPECISCLMDKGHGPYWQASFQIENETKTIFLGKQFKAVDLDKILLHDYLYKKRQQKVFETSSEAPFRPKKPEPHNRVDRIDLAKLPKKRNNSRPKVVLEPPSQQEFERDMSLLNSETLPENRKLIYRRLIKKYHPDQYNGNPMLNDWMAEINGEFNKV